MYYQIEHTTRFCYSQPITESVVELRMQPRTEPYQRCTHFTVTVQPHARVRNQPDALHNIIHHFDIPGQHQRLTVRTRAHVQMTPAPPIPDALPVETWALIDALPRTADLWDSLHPSARTPFTPLLRNFSRELDATRRADPLTLLRDLNSHIYRAFEYVPNATEVDSPIDHALSSRRGVCQDFSHVFIALARGLGIPARYVSGYLFYRRDNPDRSVPDASHAWIEAYLPPLGWVGFDPTNNIIAAERHIRVAVGRDYDDVPPTRGVFRGSAESELEVAVQIALMEPPAEASVIDVQPLSGWTPPPPLDPEDAQQQAQQ